MTILVSACLLGMACRYDGKSCPHDGVLSLLKEHTLIPLCPEILGGLPTPRVPAERVGDRVLRADGVDVTDAYWRGAQEVLRLVKLYGITHAVLKERSPSCGKGKIYDGSFSRRFKDGDGVLAALLTAEGVKVTTESALADLFQIEKEENV